MSLDPVSVTRQQPAPAAKPQALFPALIALVLPLAAFLLAWAYAGKIPMAVPKAEWGTWFVMGALMGLTALAGLVFGFKALARGGYRSLVVAGLLLNVVLLLVAWAGLFG
jgi:phage terminase large subunit-like protein